jgi:hypothetical protein
MTYEEFLDIPDSVLKDLKVIIILKEKHNMDMTAEEKEICEHIDRFSNERKNSAELNKQRRQLEKLFEK